MDSFTIHSCLEIIAEEPKKTVKVAFLEEFLEDEDFGKVVKYAYDPLMNFGILKKIDTGGHSGTENFSEETWWILDKLADRILTGNSAKARVGDHLLFLNKESQELFHRILNKDLRAGFSAKSVNKAHKGFIKTFPYMRCSTQKEVPLTELNWEAGVFSQEKADGMFVNINVSGEALGFDSENPCNDVPFQTKVVTRAGQTFPRNFGGIDMMLVGGYQYHGEALVWNDIECEYLSRKKGNGRLNSVLQGGSLGENLHVHFRLWDMVPLEDVQEGICNTTYENRWGALRVATQGIGNKVHMVHSPVLHHMEEVQAHFDEVVGDGNEGLVIKNKSAIWKDGTSRQQVKMKAERECELLVEHINNGNGKYAGMVGSLACISLFGGVKVNVSGLTDAQRNDNSWPGSIITVKFNEVISSKSHGGALSLFLPRLVERRFDKHIPDTTEYILGL